MIRGWLILTTFVFGVLFRLFKDGAKQDMYFPFSSRALDAQTWIYYLMEHVVAILVCLCILIQDSTPRWLLWLFFYILVLDMMHYLLFFRDETVGFNLVKVILFGLPFLWIQLRQYWK
jgi:hypothetical protein